jgi:hypothetical protein
MWFFMLFGTPAGLLTMMSGLNPASRTPADEAPAVPEGLSS